MRITLIAMLAFPLAARATIWQVGPGQTYTMPSQVTGLVNDGDTVDIETGTYLSDVAPWTANNLLLRGVGGFAHMESNGFAWADKAIWVIQGNNTTVEWIEFSECAVPDQNGAGIRQEGLNLTVRHCWFHNNENGILAGELHPSTIRIEHSEFGHNGYGDGFSHNLYIGNVDSLIFRYNYSHHAHVGHELKSRAWVNMIEYNRFSNEADGDASREVDLPNGGPSFLIGNVIQQGPQGQNSNLVGYGLEGLTNPGAHQLFAINNTLVNEKNTGSFFQTNANVLLKAYNNILAGGGSFVSAWPFGVDTLGNVLSNAIGSFLFTDAVLYDYHLDAASPARSIGYPAGMGGGYALVALEEYVHPVDNALRCQHATLDAGAFEFCSTALCEVGEGTWSLFPNPATDRITLGLSSGIVQRVQLSDALGRMLRDVSVNTARELVLDVSDLPNGVHVVRLLGPHVTATERRFLKL